MLTLRTRLPIVAASFGAWPLGCIILGRHADDLIEIERAAVIAHELGHLRRWHTARVLWWKLRGIDPATLASRRRVLEYEADDYAIRAGHAVGLFMFLGRLPQEFSDSHPSPYARRACIRHRAISAANP